MAQQVLVIGVGSIGERHVRCFLRTDRARVSICEVNEQLRQTIAQRYPVEAAYGTIDEAIQDRSFDTAVICTPAHLHIPLAEQLLGAGCALLIEKPLSTSFEGVESFAERVLATVDAADRIPIVGVAYVLRQHPALIDMKAAIEGGEFGRPVQLTFVGGQNFPTYRPAYREIYYADRATGGGAVQDALTHTMNAAHWLVGRVSRLAADADHQVLEGVEVEDTVHVIARHGQLLGSYSLNQHQPANESTWTIVCERGMARFEPHRHRWLALTEVDGPWQERLAVKLERDDLFVRQANSFLDAVERSEPGIFPCSLADAAHTLQINLSILEAWQSGKWVELPEHLVGPA